MQSTDIPAKLPVPFAASGDKNSIPNTSLIGITPGAASFPDGFPPLTSQAITAGGIPPTREDFNGAFFALSAAVRWLQAGGLAVYDSAFSTAIGGYPNGAVLRRSDKLGFWVSTADNNTTDPDGGSPANWTSIASVRSVFGRTGAVVAATGDYAVAQVTGAAPLASPAITGTPTAPTAATGTISTQLATCAFANPAFSAAGNGYVKLPSGIIIQWATVFVGDPPSVGGTTGTLTFPVAFSSACFACSVSTIETSGNGAVVASLTGAPSTTGAPWRLQEWQALAQSASIVFVAIGV